MPIRFEHKPGLVVYVTAGDPSLDATREIALAAIDAGADVIELGVPFSDPLADGPVIQRASERALARGTKLSDRLAEIAAHSKGFVYAISRTGITGKQTQMTTDAARLVERIRASFKEGAEKLPVAVGFGISNAEHVAQVAVFADAAVIGSAIVD